MILNYKIHVLKHNIIQEMIDSFEPFHQYGVHAHVDHTGGMTDKTLVVTVPDTMTHEEAFYLGAHLGSSSIQALTMK